VSVVHEFLFESLNLSTNNTIMSWNGLTLAHYVGSST
jgi:hypothetical protein